MQRDLAWEAQIGLNPGDGRELDDVEEEKYLQQGPDKEFQSIGPKLERRPDFQSRLVQWRIDHHLPATVDCSAQSSGRSVTPPAILGITEVPQHSVANNIFRKRKIVVDIYDNTSPADGDIVDVWFNGRYKGRITLQPEFLSTSLPLTLEPSDILPWKSNRLTFQAVSTGSSAGIPVASLAVKGKKDYIFSGSQIAVHGAGTINLALGEKTTLRMALGLACVNPVAYPQSAIHIQDAQQAGFARIVSPDRANTNIRRSKNVPPWKAANPTAVPACKANALINPTLGACDVDEYPQAMFLENQALLPGAGKPNMRAIPLGDNRGSGAKVGAYATPYLDADPLSPIFARHTPDQLEIIVPVPGSRLFCRNAF